MHCTHQIIQYTNICVFTSEVIHYYKTLPTVNIMVLILDGNSEIGAHVRHLNKSRADTNRILFLSKDLFSLMRAQHVLSYQII